MPENNFTEARLGPEILDSDRLSINKAYSLIKLFKLNGQGLLRVGVRIFVCSPH